MVYVQHFAKGIVGRDSSDPGLTDGVTKAEAFDMVAVGPGILSNWWRRVGTISPAQVAQKLTETNLDQHLHSYALHGPNTPFVSVATGCVERDALLMQNRVHSAVDTALDFATDAWARPGAVYFGWTLVGLNPAVALSPVSEAVRELNVYRRWSPYQLEGEVTAKVHIPANQIQRVEWWIPSRQQGPADVYVNPRYEAPDPITNVRDLF